MSKVIGRAISERSLAYDVMALQSEIEMLKSKIFALEQQLFESETERQSLENQLNDWRAKASQ